jgi:hypothetical protein
MRGKHARVHHIFHDLGCGFLVHLCSFLPLIRGGIGSVTEFLFKYSKEVSLELLLQCSNIGRTSIKLSSKPFKSRPPREGLSSSSSSSEELIIAYVLGSKRQNRRFNRASYSGFVLLEVIITPPLYGWSMYLMDEFSCRLGIFARLL